MSKPLVTATICLLGLPGQGKTNPAVLTSLMRPNEVDLPLHSRGRILMRRKTLRDLLLQLGHQLVCVGDQGVHQVFAIDRFEVTTV